MITIIHTYIGDNDDTDDVATVDNDAWGTNRIQMMMMLMTMIIQILSFYHDGDGDNGDTRHGICQKFYTPRFSG